MQGLHVPTWPHGVNHVQEPVLPQETGSLVLPQELEQSNLYKPDEIPENGTQPLATQQSYQYDYLFDIDMLLEDDQVTGWNQGRLKFPIKRKASTKD